MPVLPLVASTIVVRPGSIRPSASAASIIATPILSLTLPPGLKASSLANSSTPLSPAGEPSSMPGRPTSGVPPTSSAMLIGIRAMSPTTIVGGPPRLTPPWRLPASRGGLVRPLHGETNACGSGERSRRGPDDRQARIEPAVARAQAGAAERVELDRNRPSPAGGQREGGGPDRPRGDPPAGPDPDAQTQPAATCAAASPEELDRGATVRE